MPCTYVSSYAFLVQLKRKFAYDYAYRYAQYFAVLNYANIRISGEVRKILACENTQDSGIR